MSDQVARLQAAVQELLLAVDLMYGETGIGGEITLEEIGLAPEDMP